MYRNLKFVAGGDSVRRSAARWSGDTYFEMKFHYSILGEMIVAAPVSFT